MSERASCLLDNTTSSAKSLDWMPGGLLFADPTIPPTNRTGELADLLLAITIPDETDTMHLIGVAGGSCSGKSFFSSQLAKQLSASSCTILPMDAYYRDLSHLPFVDRVTTNFDIPDAIDRELYFEHLLTLAAGGTITVPDYSFSTHTRSRSPKALRAYGDFIVTEGLFILYWEDIRRLLTTKIFLDLDADCCLKRRLHRDTTERGRSRQSAELQFQRTVLPMYERYILHTRQYADLILCGDAPIRDSIETVCRELSDHLD